MREIKFRGKTKEGEWIYGDLFHGMDGDMYIHIVDDYGQNVEVLPNTIGQYTGLKDANGKEIYEGDIVATTRGEFIYEVVYDDKRFASFCLCRKQDMFKHYFGEALEAEECKVIDNIHDNPELIEK